jgi:cell division protein FtsQ
MVLRNSNDSMHDRAKVRGVSRGRANKKRRPSGSSIARASKSAARTIGKIAAFTGLSIGIVLGGAATWDWATTSPSFALATITIEGNSRATRDSIVHLSGVIEGQNLLVLDASAIERMIEAHPWVKNANVTRAFPRSLSIEIEEHEPVALVALGHLYYADSTGAIVKRYAPGENEKLPIITGLSREDIETDDGEAKAKLVSAIDFVAELKLIMKKEMPSLAEVHLDPAIGLSFVLSEEDQTVIVGHAPYTTSIERYVKVRAALAEKGVRASRIVIGGDRRPDRAIARLSQEEQAKSSMKDEQLGPALVSLE